MTVDLLARSRYLEEHKAKSSMDGMFKSVSEAIELKKENQKIMESIMQKDDFIAETFDKLGKAVVMLYKSIPKQITLPKIFPIEGKVQVEKPITVANLSELQVSLTRLEKLISALYKKDYPTNFVVDNLSELQEYFKSLEQKISGLTYAISSVPAPKIEMPKIEVPKITIPKVEQDTKALQKLTSAITENMEEIVESLKSVSVPPVKFPKTISVDNFPPQVVPHPVTNININALQGVVKTTGVTVGTNPTPLPGYGQLEMRRSMIIFNNSANTIYVGGSDVTTSNGMPILTQTFSPAIDAGYMMVFYGIAASSGNDIRVMEISSETQPTGGTNLT